MTDLPRHPDAIASIPHAEGNNMSLSMTCRHCGTPITADSEDELVTDVQNHARTHGDKPDLTPEHILSRLHRLQRTLHDHP